MGKAMQYKTVAAPSNIVIGKKDGYGTAVRQYASLIQREASNGWRLLLIQEIPVTKKNGCLAGLLGNPYTTLSFNMLVFERDD